MNNFEEACMLSNEDWINFLPTEIEPYKFSKHHNKQMNKLFNKMRNNKYHKYTKNTTRAIVVAALISSMTITAFAIPQSREYIIRRLFNHSSYTIKDTSYTEIVSDLTVGYIPDEFVLTDKFESINIYSYEYWNNDKYIIISKYTLDNKINFDTEMYESEEIIINNIKYILYDLETEICGLIWNNNEYIYTIRGNISNEELMKIASKIE